MKNAKALAGQNGKSVVGILTDAATMEKKAKPIINFDERVLIARSLSFVDAVVTQETYSPYDNIIAIRPDILIESSSHEIDDNVNHAMQEIGGRIIRLPYFPTQSSTKIKADISNTVSN